MNKVTLLSRKRIEELPGVDVSGEEREGRLTQHVEDLDTVSDETVQQLCTGAHVFCNTLGTTRARAGSAVRAFCGDAGVRNYGVTLYSGGLQAHRHGDTTADDETGPRGRSETL